MKKKIYFLVNPISGGKNKANFSQLVSKNLDTSKFDYDIEEWSKNMDAGEMAKKAIANGFDIIVAVGGDGTINRVVKAMTGHKAAMAIVPFGSGNGFSRHMNIPLNTEKAIQLLNSGTIRKVDTVKVNDETFVNVSGVGFDAHIGYLFATASTRGFKTYAKIVMRELSGYKPQHYKLVVDGKEYAEDAFLISVANASQWGNNAYIAPGAKVDDGLINAVVMKPFKWFSVPGIALRMFNRNIDKSSVIKTYVGKDITIVRNGKGPVHYDGEPAEMGREIKYSVQPASLNIVTP